MRSRVLAVALTAGLLGAAACGDTAESVPTAAPGEVDTAPATRLPPEPETTVLPSRRDREAREAAEKAGAEAAPQVPGDGASVEVVEVEGRRAPSPRPRPPTPHVKPAPEAPDAPEAQPAPERPETPHRRPAPKRPPTPERPR